MSTLSRCRVLIVDDYRQVLLLVAQRLEQSQISYMVSGSTALGFYGRPRMTRDIDIVLEMTVADTDRIDSLFRDEFSVDVEEVRDAARRRAMFNLIHFETVVKIDFIVRKDTPYRREEFSRRRQFDLDGQWIWVVAPEDLILSKLHWAKDSHSEMQLKDVRTILSITGEVDGAYLDRWALELGVVDLLNEVRAA